MCHKWSLLLIQAHQCDIFKTVTILSLKKNGINIGRIKTFRWIKLGFHNIKTRTGKQNRTEILMDQPEPKFLGTVTALRNSLNFSEQTPGL